MRRIILFALALLWCAVPATAQPEPSSFLLRCMTSTADPTHTVGIVNLCSSTTDGRFRVDVKGIFPEETVHASGDPAIAVHGVRLASCGVALSGGNNRYQPMQFDAVGNLCINLASNGAGSTTATDNGSVAAAQANIALTLGMPLVWDNTAWVRRQGFHLVDEGTFTPGADGVAVLGGTADETATDSVTEGQAGAARITLDRKLITSPYPHTAGGLAIHRSIDLDEGTGEVVKASAGQVYAMWVTNTATATRFIKFYNATSCTMGTGTPVITIGIPGNSSDDIAGSFGPGGMGIAFSTGICVGATTGVADADTGAPGANDVIANVYFK